MTWVDWIAALASGYGSACLQLRAQALKPRMGDYPEGPGDVRRALFILSLSGTSRTAPSRRPTLRRAPPTTLRVIERLTNA